MSDAAWLKTHKAMLRALADAAGDHAVSVKERAMMVAPQLKTTVKVFEEDGSLGVQEFNSKVMAFRPNRGGLIVIEKAYNCPR